jgi:hypothetical protein
MKLNCRTQSVLTVKKTKRMIIIFLNKFHYQQLRAVVGGKHLSRTDTWWQFQSGFLCFYMHNQPHQQNLSRWNHVPKKGCQPCCRYRSVWNRIQKIRQSIATTARENCLLPMVHHPADGQKSWRYIGMMNMHRFIRLIFDGNERQTGDAHVFEQIPLTSAKARMWTMVEGKSKSIIRSRTNA